MNEEIIKQKLEDVLEPLWHDNWAKYIILFSLVEAFMKRRTEYRVQEEGVAKPNWDKLIQEVWSRMAADGDLSKALSYLTEDPCREQIVKGGKFRFDPKKLPENTPQQIIVSLSIRSLRNNVVHGGKYVYRLTDQREGDGPLEREGKLFHHSTTILLWLLENELAKGDQFYRIGELEKG